MGGCETACRTGAVRQRRRSEEEHELQEKERTWKTDLIDEMVVKVECAENDTLVAAVK